MTADEFRKRYVHSPREASSIREDNGTAKILQSAMEQIRFIQNNCCSGIPEGNIRIEIEVFSESKADADNILKGVLDGLQGFAYRNDRQVRESQVRMYPSNHHSNPMKYKDENR